MAEREIVIQNPSGLHARPATQVVGFVQAYPGTAEVVKGEKIGNLKSILNLLSLGLTRGSQVTLRVCGPDEEDFLDRLAAFIAGLEG